MALPASQTGDRLVSVIIRRFFSGKALYGLASVRAAVKDGRHEVSCMTGRALPRFDLDQETKKDQAKLKRDQRHRKGPVP